MGSHLWAFQKWCGTAPTKTDHAIAEEFIHSCYAECLFETAHIQDQLALLIAALRAGKTLLPRDAWLGGAIPAEGCTVCGRSQAELIQQGHLNRPEFLDGHAAEQQRRVQVQSAPSNPDRLGLTFGEAMHALRTGHSVCRKHWPKTDSNQPWQHTIWLQLRPTGLYLYDVVTEQHIAWEPSPLDVLADDWEVER
jgi:hypothetical protein